MCELRIFSFLTMALEKSEGSGSNPELYIPFIPSFVPQKRGWWVSFPLWDLEGKLKAMSV
jgi:hypothetical protein